MLALMLEKTASVFENNFLKENKEKKTTFA